MLDPSPILRQLAKEKVDYVVIGGIAMTARGCAHVTDDLDICYRRTASNLAAIAAALAPLHPYLRGAPPGLPFRLDVPTLQAGLNFTLITDQGALDLLGEVSGVGTYDDVFAQSTEEDLYGLRGRVLTVEALIASKKAAARIKDRNHLLELEELKKMQEDKG